MSSKLFQPLQVGSCKLSNRIVMAPLTRFRSDDEHVPLDMVAEYYGQRASVPGTLLISEATFISQRASGYPSVPGIFTEKQIAGWKKVTDAVHAKGSYIYCQLWALGRAANPDFLKSKGERLLSASAIAMEDGAPVPEEMTVEEIQLFKGDYIQAAKNAIAAGFDGVEIHNANGYLLDQFLEDVSNKRTDNYGGSIEKRASFPLEVARGIVDAIGADKVGIRFSPYSPFQGMKMKEPLPTFNYMLEQLKPLKLAYMHLVESRVSGNADVEGTERITPLMETWGKTSPILVAGGFKPDSAKRAVDEEFAHWDVAVVFGRYFIANPDLVFKIEKGIELTKYDRDTFYNAREAKGYTDYPFSEEWVESKA